jgi:hypothetical protein
LALSPLTIINLDNKNHDCNIKENFWKYCKRHLDIGKENIKPDFGEKECFDYFKKTCQMLKNSCINFPSWFKELHEPTKNFNLEAPSYREITKVINKIKANGSPCPNDQVSIIVLKKCPILRTALHRIIRHCWENNNFPTEWKYAFTILIYKRESNKDPSNFRPIALQPVLAKIYSSVIRNRIYTFLMQNQFIDTNLQKGFWSGISGTVEHTELLSYIINHARIKQRQVIVTLLDLKNAFGEIDHDIVMKTLEYHHIPNRIQKLLKSYYTNYLISVGTDTFVSDPIVVKKGVLQGDCLSPLLFNMVVNTLLKTIDTEKVKCMGYNYCGALSPRHWFQFADDSALVTSTVEDSQALLNVFTKWCNWAGLKICPRKCKTFAMKKMGTRSIQFHPYLRLNNEQIPTIKDNEEFVYLGKTFTIHMKPEKIEQELKNELSLYANVIHRLPLHPSNKLMIIMRYVYSKLRWRLTCYDIALTWVIQNLDPIVRDYVKRWLNLHQGANTRHLYLPGSKLGIKLSLPSDILRACNLSKRNILKQSVDLNIRELYKLTIAKHLDEERLLHMNIEKPERAKRQLTKETADSIMRGMAELKEQNSILTFIRQHCSASFITEWYNLTQSLSANTFKFSRKALIFSLANNSNLKRWMKTNDDKCMLCQQKQTQLHVLNNCSTAAADGRYTWRHDSILFTLVYYIQQLTTYGFEVFADLQGYKSPNQLFHRMRPDIVLVKDNVMTIIELTCCFETNLVKSNNYKKRKYENIEKDCRNKMKINKIFVEVTALGFIPKSIIHMNKVLTKYKLNINRMNLKMSEVAIRASYFIYTQRNKEWKENDILKFY